MPTIPMQSEGQPRPMTDEERREKRLKYPGAQNNTVLEAEVIGIELQDSRWTDDRTGELKKELNFKFKSIEPGDFHDRWFWGSVSTWFSDKPTCKLRQWVQGILDVDVLPDGYVLNTDQLIGLQCRILIGAKARDDGSLANWVSEVRPSRGTVIPMQAQTGDGEPF